MPKYYYNPVSDIIEQTPVLDYNSKDLFPSTGNEAYLYLDKLTNYVYRWAGTQYILINNYKYTGTTKRQVGGIKSGVMLQNIELEKVVKVLLEPEEITGFGALGSAELKTSGKLEVGSSIVKNNTETSITFTAVPGITPDTTEVELKYKGKAGETEVNFTTNLPITNSLSLSGTSGGSTAAHYSEIPGFISFRAKRIDSIGQEYFSSEIKYEWAYKNIIFQHTLDGGNNDSLSNIPINNRVNIPDNSIVGLLEKVQRVTTVASTTPTYLYILLPESYGVVNSAKSGGFEIPFISRTSLYEESKTVEGRTFNVSYRVYRSVNPFSGSLIIDIS